MHMCERNFISIESKRKWISRFLCITILCPLVGSPYHQQQKSFSWTKTYKMYSLGYKTMNWFFSLRIWLRLSWRGRTAWKEIHWQISIENYMVWTERKNWKKPTQRRFLGNQRFRFWNLYSRPWNFHLLPLT